MSRRRNKKRRRARKERAEEKANQPRRVLPKREGVPAVARFFAQFRGGPHAPRLNLLFAGPVVKWDDPTNPSEGLREKAVVQEALEESLPKTVN